MKLTNNIKSVSFIGIWATTVFLIAPLSAQLTIWSGPSNGDFFDGANWTAGAPNPALDGQFDHNMTIAVELTSSGNLRDLFFRDGNTTLFAMGTSSLAFGEVEINSDFLNEPDVTLDNVSLFGNDLLIESVVNSAKLQIVNDGLVSVNFLDVDLPEADSILSVQAADLLTDTLNLYNGDLELSDNSLCLAFDMLSIGIDSDSAPALSGAMLFMDDSSAITGPINVGLGELRLSASSIETIDVSVGSLLSNVVDDSRLQCFGACEITSPNISIGEMHPALFLLGIGSDFITNGEIFVGSDGEMRMLTSASCCAERLTIEGRLAFSGAVINPQSIKARIDVLETGTIELADGISAELQSPITNFGGEIIVNTDADLTIADSYLGENTFTGGGTTRFQGPFNPDDPSEFAEELTGTLTFDTQNVIFESTSTYFVSFQGQEHDRVIINGNVAIQGASIAYQENPFEPVLFNDGDVFPILQVSGNRVGGFAGQPEGSIIGGNALFDMAISYVGGNGNDITLTAIQKDILFGDVNLDGEVNLLDVAPFVDLLTGGNYQVEADIDRNFSVNLLDVTPFVSLLSGN